LLSHKAMFATADWTQPQIGGLLNECIEKEERQLRAPKPRIDVQHIWDSNTLAGRATMWKNVTQRTQPANTMELTRAKLGLSVPHVAAHEERQSRSSMIAARRTRDSLDAMQRERAADAKSTETGFKSAASLFTPDDLQKLRPIYAPNETCATATTNELIGLGAKRVPLQMSRYARSKPFPPDFVDCRNGPERLLAERSRTDARERPRPWRTETLPREIPNSSNFPRGTDSSFCVRSGMLPVVGGLEK